jgi:hypothetical protein
MAKSLRLTTALFFFSYRSRMERGKVKTYGLNTAVRCIREETLAV